MPRARYEIEELARKNEDRGFTDLAAELKRIARNLSWEEEEIPIEVDALYAAHYAGQASTGICGVEPAPLRIH